MMRDQYFGPLGDKRYEEYTKDIHKSGTLLVSLIDDILDLSKIEAKKYDLQEDRLNLNDLVKECLTQNKIAAEAKQQIIRVDLPVDFPALLADHRAILQILNNILSNAIKFSEKGKAIELQGGLSRDGGIMLTVTDTGIGISPKDIALITQPFMQVQSSHSIARESSGLGLYLVSSLMTLHGGDLDIESKLGEGTVIKLTFPPERTISA